MEKAKVDDAVFGVKTWDKDKTDRSVCQSDSLWLNPPTLPVILYDPIAENSPAALFNHEGPRFRTKTGFNGFLLPGSD